MPTEFEIRQNRIAMLAARGIGVNSSYRNGRYGRKGWGNNPPPGKPSGLGGGGGPSLWTPADMASELWLNAHADNITLAAGTNIAQWDDLSGNGRHAVQANATYQPEWDAANSRLSFPTGGNGERMTGVGPNLPVELHNGDSVRVFVCRHNGVTGRDTYSTIFQIGDAALDDVTWRYEKDASNLWQHYYNGTANGSTAPQTPWVANNETDLKIISVVKSGTTVSIYEEGNLMGSGTHANDNLVGDLAWILGWGTFSNGWTFEGWFHEVVLATTPADHDKLVGYAAHKYGLTADLPVDHPYKSAAPVASNPFVDNIVLLMNFQGANDSTTFTDESTVGNVPVALGNAKLTTTAPLQGVSSAILDGTGDAIRVPYSADWVDYNVPQTIEMLIQLDDYASTSQWLIGSRSGSSGIEYRINNATGVTFTETGIANHSRGFGDIGPLVNGTPYVFTLERRADNLWHLYLDGVEFGSVDAGTINGVGFWNFGMNSWNNQGPCLGKFGAIRVTRAAVYNGDHDPYQYPFIT